MEVKVDTEPVAQTANRILAASVSIAIEVEAPMGQDVDCLNWRKSHPNISCLKVEIRMDKTIPIGHINAQILGKSAMEAISPNRMWEECQAFDATHKPAAKLDKVENYLANESFSSDVQTKLDSAERLLFIEEVYIDLQFRGHGLGLVAVDLLIKGMGLEDKCVALLQAGPISGRPSSTLAGTSSVAEAYEKIARYWRKMGLAEWSDSDDAWLCLWTGERPKIEDVVPDLFTS